MIDAELREHAESLYIVEGLTLEEVSGATGVNVRTIENWSAQEAWPEQRREYRKALGDIKRNTVLLRKKLISKALQSLDPQDVYAAARLETAASKGKNDDPAYASRESIREINTPEDAINALQEAVEKKINLMLTKPGDLSLAGVKDMKKAFELIDEMKKRYAVKQEETGGKQGLNKENLKKIEEEILHLVR